MKILKTYEFFFNNKSPITIKKGEIIIAKYHGAILGCLVLNDVHENDKNIKVLIIGKYIRNYSLVDYAKLKLEDFPKDLIFKLFDHSKNKILWDFGTHDEYVPSKIKIPNIEYTNEGKYPRSSTSYAIHTYHENGTYMKITKDEKESMIKEFENNKHIISQIQKQTNINLDDSFEDYFLKKDTEKYNL